MSWWLHLDKTRGSRPRCVSFMDGHPEDVARRLENLVAWPGVAVAPDSAWMPTGRPVAQSVAGHRDPAEEATLDNPNPLLTTAESKALKDWWLNHPHPMANTPNWDIASQCRVNGQKGLLLVEAKAHANELKDDGKSLDPKASKRSFENHAQIGRAISDAAAVLQRDTGLPCAVSRDLRYQMSNRFAMACKLTEMGYAVVLVYLGFLNANDMSDQGQPFDSPDAWRVAVERHSEILFPSRMWEQPWTLNGLLFLPLIRSLEWRYTE